MAFGSLGPTRRPLGWIVGVGGVVGLAAVAVVLLGRSRRSRLLIAPAPSSAPEVERPEPLPASTAAVPVTVALAPLAARLERAVPMQFGSLDDRIPVRGVPGLTVAISLDRNPFHVSFVGSDAIVRGTVRYALKAWYRSPFLPPMTASCGNGGPREPRLRLVVRGPVSIEPDWSLRAHARLAELAPASSSARDRCVVSSVGLDITPEVVHQARAFLEGQAGALDSAVSRVDVRTPVSQGWQTLQQPLPLGDSLWLLVHPESVRRGVVRGLGDSLEVTVALSAHPSIVVGARPAATDVPLPRLDTGAVSPGFIVGVEGRAGYPEISARLQRELQGATLREMGRTIVLDSVRVFGIGGGRLALEVRLGGDAQARLYLTGTPRVDEGGEVTVPDLDFDIQTRDIVLKTESWLAGDRLRQALRRQARWSAAPDIDRMRARIQAGLNQKLSGGLLSEGTIDRVTLDGILATKDALLVRASMTGSATLHVLRY